MAYREDSPENRIFERPSHIDACRGGDLVERIELLTALGADRHLTDLPDSVVRRYARRLAARAPAVAACLALQTSTRRLYEWPRCVTPIFHRYFTLRGVGLCFDFRQLSAVCSPNQGRRISFA
jgi:hypothetical protein